MFELEVVKQKQNKKEMHWADVGITLADFYWVQPAEGLKCYLLQIYPPAQNLFYYFLHT